jgi:hypothetical protein
VKALGLLIAAALLLPVQARAERAAISSCARMTLPASAARGRLDRSTRAGLELLVDFASMRRDPRYRMVIYAPETRCRTARCNTRQTRRRGEAVRNYVVGRGIDADRIRRIGLDEGVSRFGSVSAGTVLVTVQSPASPTAVCNTKQINPPAAGPGAPPAPPAGSTP